MSALRQPVSDPIETGAGTGEAEARLRSARRRDYAFAIKRVIGNNASFDDVDMLTEIVMGASGRLTKDYIVQELRARGRSPAKAEELATALTTR